MEFTTKSFWKQTAERAIKTFAQAALSVIGVEAVAVNEVNWVSVVAIACTATVISVLTSIASSGVGEHNSPSMVTTQPKPVNGDSVVLDKQFTVENKTASELEALANIAPPRNVKGLNPLAQHEDFIVRGDN